MRVLAMGMQPQAQLKPPAESGVSLRKSADYSPKRVTFHLDDDAYVAFGATATRVETLQAQQAHTLFQKGAEAAQRFHQNVVKPALESIAAGVDKH
ncbi:MAG: hypothetical protein KC474_11405 [Cyanobacteria bacterium HKST-UBA04]|nr:hypothetical protein [Cyanobacteria bacterium HKST-UBA04]